MSNTDDGAYCWCGTRMTQRRALCGRGDAVPGGWHCSAHGYQERVYGPTPELPTLPHA